MYQYPNYSMNNMPQYQNQYQSPQMPMQYMDRLSQLQTMQQPMIPQQMQRTTGLNGGIVDDFNIITANDVPMDGNGAVFIKKDGSEIQIRNWTANGTITTSVFKPVLVDNANEISTPKENTLERLSGAFDARFNELLEKIDKLEKSIKAPSKKKEVVDDE